MTLLRHFDPTEGRWVPLEVHEHDVRALRDKVNDLRYEVSELYEELVQTHDKLNRCLGCCTPAKGK